MAFARSLTALLIGCYGNPAYEPQSHSTAPAIEETCPSPWDIYEKLPKRNIESLVAENSSYKIPIHNALENANWSYVLRAYGDSSQYSGVVTLRNNEETKEFLQNDKLKFVELYEKNIYSHPFGKPSAVIFKDIEITTDQKVTYILVNSHDKNLSTRLCLKSDEPFYSSVELGGRYVLARKLWKFFEGINKLFLPKPLFRPAQHSQDVETAILSSSLYSAEPRAIQQQTEQPQAVYVRSVNDILMLKGLTNICDDAEEALKGNVILFLYDKSEKSKSLAEILAKVVDDYAESRKVKLLIAGEDCMAYGHLANEYKLQTPLIIMLKDSSIKLQSPEWWKAEFEEDKKNDRARHFGRSIKPYLLDLQN